jgi:DNA transposition AAA+ family ATPase
MTQKLSDSDVHNIRERLNKFMRENPVASNRTIAAEIGFSSSYISLFRNDKFPTKESEPDVAAKIESYLNDVEEALQSAVSSGHLKFALTTAAQDVFRIAQYAATERKIGVVVGKPGCGKTISVTEYKKRNPNSILIEIGAVVSQRTLLHDISSALKIPIYITGRENKQTLIPSAILFREIIEKLTGTKRLLIADEGENLTTGCLEIIRRIHDFTRVGVLLSGTNKLLDRLRGPRRELQQLYSRVGICKEIDQLKIGDVRAILLINFPDALKFSNNFLQLSKNNGRVLEHLIDLVRKTLQETGDELSEELIDEAAGSLLT